MRSYEVIEILRKARKPVLTTVDMAKFTKGNRRYASLMAQRMMNREWLNFIERGKYAPVEAPFLSIASNLVFPSYISFLGALLFHGLTEQLPAIITVVATRSRPEATLDKTPVRFVKLPMKRFFGYRKELDDGWPIFVAEPEKAILDSIYLPNYCPEEAVKEALKFKTLDRKKLKLWARGYPTEVRRRLLSLEEEVGQRG